MPAAIPRWFYTRFPQFAPSVAPVNVGEVYVPPPAPPPRTITGPIISTLDWKSVGQLGEGVDPNWVRTGNSIQYIGVGSDQLRSPPVEVGPEQVVKIAVSVVGQINDGTTPNTIRQAKGACGISAYRADGRPLGSKYIDPIRLGTYEFEMVMPATTHHCIFSLFAYNNPLAGTYQPDAPVLAQDWLRVTFNDLERVI